MVRTIIVSSLLILLSLHTKGQHDISPNTIKYFVAWGATDSTYHLGRTLPGQRTTTGQPNFRYFTNETDYLTLIDSLNIKRKLDFNEVQIGGESIKPGIYTHNGKIVIARKSFIVKNASDLTNDSLFAYHRGRGSILSWEIGEEVYPDQVRKFGNQVYKCIAKHIATNFTTDVLKWQLELNNCPPWIPPKGTSDTYVKEACVTFNGSRYVSKIDNNNSNPNNAQSWTKLLL